MGAGTITVIVIVVVLVVAAAVVVPTVRRRRRQHATHPDIGLPDLGALEVDPNVQPKSQTRDDTTSTTDNT